MKTALAIAPNDRRRLCFVATQLPILLVPFLVLLGCSAPKYKPAPRKTPPPVLLNLPYTEPSLEALLHAVIIYRGAGSWKQDAFWDEYVMTVANRGSAEIVIESAALTDFQDRVVMAGTQPWELEQASLTLVDQGSGLPRDAAIQLGGGLGVLALSSGAGAALVSGGTVGSAAGAAAGGILALPILVGGSIYVNITNRGLIEREFQRRRVKLPATLLPGEFVAGSFFFRISPGPKRLHLQCRVDGESHDAVIDLAPLAAIHLQKNPAEGDKPATPPAK